MLVSVGSIIRESIDLYKNNAKLFIKYVFLTLVPPLLIGAIVGGALASTILIGRGENLSSAIPTAIVILFIMVGLLAFYLSIWINIAFIQTMNRAQNNAPARSIKESLREARTYIWRSLGTSILVGLYTIWPLIVVLIGWATMRVLASTTEVNDGLFLTFSMFFGLLGVYGVFHVVYYSIKLVFATYEVILDNKKPIESLRTSSAMTKKRWWSIFWRILAPALVFLIVLSIFQTAVEGIARIIGGDIAEIIAFSISILMQFLATPVGMAAILILYRSVKQTPVQTAPVEPTQAMN